VKRLGGETSRGRTDKGAKRPVTAPIYDLASMDAGYNATDLYQTEAIWCEGHG